MILIKKMFNIRSWLLRYLSLAGVSKYDIAKIFASVIRSVIEYAVPVYHKMLNSNQSDEIEKLQRRSIEDNLWPQNVI